jgi:hypothetical protein
METIRQDLRFGLRMLWRSPGVAAVAVFTLALGIGASAIVFSIIYNGVLYPFPYRSADRLTAINVGYGLFPQMVYTRRDSSEMLAGVGATPNAMEFWGVPPPDWTRIRRAGRSIGSTARSRMRSQSQKRRFDSITLNGARLTSPT